MIWLFVFLHCYSDSLYNSSDKSCFPGLTACYKLSLDLQYKQGLLDKVFLCPAQHNQVSNTDLNINAQHLQDCETKSSKFYLLSLLAFTLGGLPAISWIVDNLCTGRCRRPSAHRGHTTEAPCSPSMPTSSELYLPTISLLEDNILRSETQQFTSEFDRDPDQEVQKDCSLRGIYCSQPTKLSPALMIKLALEKLDPSSCCTQKKKKLYSLNLIKGSPVFHPLK